MIDSSLWLQVSLFPMWSQLCFWLTRLIMRAKRLWFGWVGVSLEWIPDRNEHPSSFRGNEVVKSLVVAISSGSTSMSGFGGPVGWQETASAALCRTSGIWIIRNMWRRVFSFRLGSRAFGISSRDRSPSILSNGLWSTVMIRSLQPREKNLVLSRASATTKASPSTGA